MCMLNIILIGKNLAIGSNAMKLLIHQKTENDAIIIYSHLIADGFIKTKLLFTNNQTK